jgi:hypothetical protein
MKQKKDWSPLKTFIIFQFRLLLDAVRDFILSPISFVCIFVDIVTGQKIKKESCFYRLMLIGRRSDQRINLFEQFDKENKKDNKKSEQ